MISVFPPKKWWVCEDATVVSVHLQYLETKTVLLIQCWINTGTGNTGKTDRLVCVLCLCSMVHAVLLVWLTVSWRSGVLVDLVKLSLGVMVCYFIVKDIES